MTNDFIFELGCEELPSGSVWPLADEFATHMLAALEKAQLSHGEVKRFATPRRIAIVINELESQQTNQSNTRRGPAVDAAYNSDGNPTPALLGFAKSCGVGVEQLTKQETDKGAWFVHHSQTTGAQTKTLLPGLVKQSLAALTIAKPMRWGDSDIEFARPVHWVVMMFGQEVLDCEILGVKSGQESKGHRFHHPHGLKIACAAHYELQMKEAFVIVDFALRRQMIQEQVAQLVAPLAAKAVMPDALLDEVTSIVEWPQALLANFEREFLAIPSEALIASMQSHQKCFALHDKNSNLLPHFITIANIASENPQQVILGNEKVMRARLSDADFFFKQDRKKALSEHITATEQVVFQVKLGSLQDKAMRIKALMLHWSDALHVSPNLAERAAILSKCDLMTGMVGEFPELQGLMGYYYALHDGEDKAVAQALNEQYMPRFAGDQLPDSDLGLLLSLADRMDTLVGIFAIGQKPSGVKDPFKLRRHALAVVRLLIKTPAPFHLTALIEQTIANYGPVVTMPPTLVQELKTFILERLQSYYQSQGLPVDLVLAVRACQEEWLFDLNERLQALQSFVTMPEAGSLSAACKRVNNILNQAGKNAASDVVEESLITTGAEQALYLQIIQVSEKVKHLYAARDYGLLLKELANLRAPVDAFFDQVMVMVDDPLLKKNRLAILVRLQQLLQGVADISVLQLP